MRRLARYATPVSILVVLLTSAAATGADNSKEAKQFDRQYAKGFRLLLSGKAEKAIKPLSKAAEIAPNHPDLNYNFACALARTGRNEEAMEALARAVEAGWGDDRHAREDPDLESVREDPRFEPLMDRIVEKNREWEERLRQVRTPLDPDRGEVFSSVGAIESEFRRRREKLEASGRLVGRRVRAERAWALLDLKVAALERYLRDEPDADDREEALYRLVRTAEGYREFRDGFGDDAQFVADTAERFLARYPNGPDAPEVDFLRARACWLAYYGPDREETQPRRAREAGSLLEEVTASYPDSSWSGRALALRMQIVFELSDGEAVPLLRDLYEAFAERHGEDPGRVAHAWQTAAAPMFQVTARESFRGKDLSGRIWDAEAMSGKVVLVDFWATWCGPCVAEFPTLREAYERFHGLGFEIVGVSLDDIDRQEFLRWIGKQDVRWPQIFTGKGWDSPLGRTFHVRFIPRSFLLDRKGRVVAMDLRGEKLLDEIASLIEPGEDEDTTSTE